MRRLHSNAEGQEGEGGVGERGKSAVALKRYWNLVAVEGLDAIGISTSWVIDGESKEELT